MTVEFIQRIVGALKKNNVDFLVTGGASKIIRGINSTTMDLDIVVKSDDNNIKKLELFANQIGTKNIDALKNLKNGRIVRLYSFPFTIDLLPRLDGLDINSAFNNSESIHFSGIKIPVISKEDLVTNYNNIPLESYEQI